MHHLWCRLHPGSSGSIPVAMAMHTRVLPVWCGKIQVPRPGPHLTYSLSAATAAFWMLSCGWRRFSSSASATWHTRVRHGTQLQFKARMDQVAKIGKGEEQQLREHMLRHGAAAAYTSDAPSLASHKQLQVSHRRKHTATHNPATPSRLVGHSILLGSCEPLPIAAPHLGVLQLGEPEPHQGHGSHQPAHRLPHHLTALAAVQPRLVYGRHQPRHLRWCTCNGSHSWRVRCSCRKSAPRECCSC